MFPTSSEAFSLTTNSKQESCVVATAKGKHSRTIYFYFFVLSLVVGNEQEINLLLRYNNQDHNSLFFFLSPSVFSDSPKTLDFLVIVRLSSSSSSSSAPLPLGRKTNSVPNKHFFQSKLGNSLAPSASTERRNVLK